MTDSSHPHGDVVRYVVHRPTCDTVRRQVLCIANVIFGLTAHRLLNLKRVAVRITSLSTESVTLQAGLQGTIPSSTFVPTLFLKCSQNWGECSHERCSGDSVRRYDQDRYAQITVYI
jgi:hypothetical protein